MSPTEYTSMYSRDGKGIAHDDFEECAECGAMVPWGKLRTTHLATHRQGGPEDYFTLIEAAALLHTTPRALRQAAHARRDGLASDTGLAGRLGLIKPARDWLASKALVWREVDRRLGPARNSTSAAEAPSAGTVIEASGDAPGRVR